MRNSAPPVLHPVIGELHPHYFGFAHPELDSGFDEFITPTMQGLARVRERRLDVLALAARTPGRGDGGKFLAACMAAYKTIVVWEILNDELSGMLKRRGFRESSELDDGQAHVVLRWDDSR